MAERLSHHFAVFNLHINDAGERADREYIAQFGQESFDTNIGPLHKDGIMSIFGSGPTRETMAWAVLCTAYANENRNDEEE